MDLSENRCRLLVPKLATQPPGRVGTNPFGAFVQFGKFDVALVSCIDAIVRGQEGFMVCNPVAQPPNSFETAVKMFARYRSVWERLGYTGDPQRPVVVIGR